VIFGPFGRVPGERAFDDARADAQPPGGEQAAQDPPADTAGQVDDSAGDDAGGLDEQVAGGVQGDGEAGARSGSVPPAASIASVMAIRRIW
jgi:hypothetical protein